MDAERAMVRLEELCARGERCRWELREKLRRWMVPAAQAERILDSLEERRFLDEARFAAAYVNDRMRFARRGRMAVKRELALKHIDPDVVDDLLEEVDMEMYEANLDYILRSRLRSMGPGAIDDYANRVKLFRFAVQRGYETSMASAAIRRLRDEAMDE